VRALYFGTYERDYPRNAQVIASLRRAGVDVTERHMPVWDARQHKLALGASDAARLGWAQVRLATGRPADADVVIVGYPGHADVMAAKRVARGRPVVFNPLVSLEDTWVGDRGLSASGGLVARTLRAIDRAAFRRSDLVVADTSAHAAYFADSFGLDGGRVAVCFVGADDRLFKPGPRADAEFSALFVGKLIPLHGVETILAAAALCPDVTFDIVGSGQLDGVLSERPSNVRHTSWVEYADLPDRYRSAGCALGIFGTSEKASRVIPNKAFQALATETPLITADTPAARELLEDGRDALLVAPGEPEALAAAIRRLAADESLRRELGAAGRATYAENASEAVLGARWRALLEQLVRSS
jgi:glycosyltransferase involved in cell wall biosynthesis